MGALEFPAGLPADSRAKVRQVGEVIHAFLRDLLVRWEDPAARVAALPRRHLRRSTGLSLAGAAATGAHGRADLVVWDEDCIHLLDFKHSNAFGEEELATYRDQLSRYAAVFRGQRREGR
jgi:ATP-dependent exoDNAse (exonuclease V) beta subunit